MKERTIELIDLHSHILPNLDDGPRTMEDSIQMCRASHQDGIETIVATPHILPGIHENNRSIILSRLAELNEALESTAKDFHVSAHSRIDASGIINNDAITQFLNDSAQQEVQSASGSDSTIDNQQSSIKILPGADVHFSSDLLERLERKEIVTVNDQGRYLMIEFAFQGIPYQAEEALFQLMANGIIPIISHPERNMEIGQRPQRYYGMIRMGCLGQVTAMSLTGEFGPEVKRNAERLLAKKLIHIIASDAHSPNRRPPILSAGVKAAEKIVGKKEAQKMVTEYPEAIINGLRPNIPEPLSP